MAYTPLNWQDGPAGGTPISAANLNRMEQGIKDAHDLLEDLLESRDPANRFQLSGALAAEDSLVDLDPAENRHLQSIWVVVPQGKVLVLKRVRFYFFLSGATRLLVHRVKSPTNSWTSPDPHGEFAPEHVLHEGDGTGVEVIVAAVNTDEELFSLLHKEAGWWVDLAIEDAS